MSDSEEISPLTEEEILAFFKSKKVAPGDLEKLKTMGFDEASLEIFEEKDYQELGIKPAPAKAIYKRGKQLLDERANEAARSRRKHLPQKPRGFRKKHLTEGEAPTDVESVYQFGDIMGGEEGGNSLLDRTMEFKELAQFEENAFKRKLIKFVVACINARKNSTIYFGVADNKREGCKHGEILGVPLHRDQHCLVHEFMDRELIGSCPKHFAKSPDMQRMVRESVGVAITKVAGVPDDRVIIEVDVEPCYKIWGKEPLHEKGSGWIRKGTESVKITNFEQFLKELETASERRCREELKQSGKKESKVLQSKLRSMICRGNSKVDDVQHQYVLVTDKINIDLKDEFKWYGGINWNFALDLEPTGANRELLSQEIHERFKFIELDEIAQIVSSPNQDVDLIEGIEFGEKRPWITARKESSQTVQDWLKNTKEIVSKTIHRLSSDTAQELPEGMVVLFIITNESLVDEFVYLITEFFGVIKQENQLVCISTNTNVLAMLGKKLSLTNETWKEMSLCCDSWEFLSSFMNSKLQVRPPAQLKIPCSTGESGISFPHAEKFKAKNIEVLGLNISEILTEELKQANEDIDEVADNALGEFYRGSPPTWNVLFFSYGPFSKKGKFPRIVQRPRVGEIVQDIQAFQQDEQEVCLFRINNQPNSGASTIGMHVLWELRKEMRCVRVEGAANYMLQGAERKNRLDGLVSNLMNLRTYGEDNANDRDNIRPVLILLDNSNLNLPTRLRDELKQSLMKWKQSSSRCKFIILACCQSSSRRSKDDSSSLRRAVSDKYIKLEQALDEDEIYLFKERLEALQNIQEQSTFHTMLAFVIMANNFDSNNSYVIAFVERAIMGIEKYPNDLKLLLHLSILKWYGSSDCTGLPTKHCNILLHPKRPLSAVNRRSIQFSVCTQVATCIVEKTHSFQVKNPPFLYVEITHAIVAKLILDRLLPEGKMKLEDHARFIFEETDFINEPFQQDRVHNTLRQLLLWRPYIDEIIQDQDGIPTSISVEEYRNNFSKIVTELCYEGKQNQAIDLLKLAHGKLNKKAKPVLAQAIARLYRDSNEFENSKDWGLRAVNESGSRNAFPFYDTLGQIYKKEMTCLFKTVKTDKIPYDFSSDYYFKSLELAVEADKYFNLALDHYNANNRQSLDVDDESGMTGGDSPGIMGRIGIRLTAYKFVINTHDFRACNKEKLLREILKQPREKQSLTKLEHAMTDKQSFQAFEEHWKNHSRFIGSIYSETKMLLAAAAKKMNNIRIDSLEYEAKQFQSFFGEEVVMELAAKIASQAQPTAAGLVDLIEFLDSLYIRNFSWSIERDLGTLKVFAFVLNRIEGLLKHMTVEFYPSERDMHQFQLCYVTCFLAQLQQQNHHKPSRVTEATLHRFTAEKYCFDLAKTVEDKKKKDYAEWPEICVFYILLNIDPEQEWSQERADIFTKCLKLLHEHYTYTKISRGPRFPTFFKLTRKANQSLKLVNVKSDEKEVFLKGRIDLKQDLTFQLDKMKITLPRQHVHAKKYNRKIQDVRFQLRFSQLGPMACNVEKDQVVDMSPRSKSIDVPWQEVCYSKNQK